MIDLFKLLPFWLQGPEIKKWADAFQARLAAWETWLEAALSQAEIANCSSAALAVHALDRSVLRLPGEPEAIWRQHVLHAFTVALESGSRRGLEGILAIFGLVNFTITERDPGQDWDVILIDLDPTELSLDSDNLNAVLQHWGRACRRYAPSYTMAASGAVAPFYDAGDFYFGSAS